MSPSEPDVDDQNTAAYVAKFGLSARSLDEVWLPRLRSLVHARTRMLPNPWFPRRPPMVLPSVGFPATYKAFGWNGGLAMYRDDWPVFQQFFRATGDSRIAVIHAKSPGRDLELEAARTGQGPDVGFVYSIDLSWAELRSDLTAGGDSDHPVTQQMFRDGLAPFYVVGDSGNWVLMADDDLWVACSIMAVHPRFALLAEDLLVTHLKPRWAGIDLDNFRAGQRVLDPGERLLPDQS